MPLRGGEGTYFGSPKTFGSQVYAPNGTLSLPSYSFSSANDTGMRYSGSQLQFVRANQMMAMDSNTVFINAQSGLDVGGSGDNILIRDAAEVLAHRRGTNAQSFGVYTTSSSSNANYERLTLKGVAGADFVITPENAGTGTLRGLQIGATSTAVGFMGATAVTRQTSGENLTNNVTSGGTDGTIADFTSLTVYATDAATIRNDIYQLARKLKQVNDALRTYGLLT